MVTLDLILRLHVDKDPGCGALAGAAAVVVVEKLLVTFLLSRSIMFIG